MPHTALCSCLSARCVPLQQAGCIPEHVLTTLKGIPSVRPQRKGVVYSQKTASCVLQHRIGASERHWACGTHVPHLVQAAPRPDKTQRMMLGIPLNTWIYVYRYIKYVKGKRENQKLRDQSSSDSGRGLRACRPHS